MERNRKRDFLLEKDLSSGKDVCYNSIRTMNRSYAASCVAELSKTLRATKPERLHNHCKLAGRKNMEVFRQDANFTLKEGNVSLSYCSAAVARCKRNNQSTSEDEVIFADAFLL